MIWQLGGVNLHTSDPLSLYDYLFLKEISEKKKDFFQIHRSSRNSWLVLSCLVLSCLVLSCLVLSCLVLSCLVLSCLVLSCLVLSCLVLSCLVSSRLVSSRLVSSRLVSSRLVSSRLVSSCLVLSCLVLSCLHWRGRRRASFPFRKRSMPFSPHLEIFFNCKRIFLY